MNTTTTPEENNQTECDTDKLIAIFKAFASPYCGIAAEDKFQTLPYMYFFMTNEMEITGYDYEPFIEEGKHCVAASDVECQFIMQFQINWPDSNLHYWQLETFRAYHNSRQLLSAIKPIPKRKRREHLSKIEQLRNLS